MKQFRGLFARLIVFPLVICTLPVTFALAQSSAPVKVVDPAPKPSLATTTLTVHVEGIRNAKGKINVALFKDAIGFPMDPSGVVAAKQVDIDAKTMTATIVFEKLPQGSYAAAVLHDEDVTGQMSYDAQGMPTKGYGISNNPPFRQAPPTPEEAKFSANQSESSISIKIIYFQ
jgi:uncharacterized protein (DUF2141 family)